MQSVRRRYSNGMLVISDTAEASSLTAYQIQTKCCSYAGALIGYTTAKHHAMDFRPGPVGSVPLLSQTSRLLHLPSTPLFIAGCKYVLATVV